MAINKDTLDSIISGLNAMPRKSEIDTPTNNIDLLVTEHVEGLMSPEDKAKLDKIDENANHYELPTASSSELGGVTTTSEVTSAEGYIPTPIIDGVPYYRNTEYKLPIATANELGGVKIGKNITINDDGVISVSDVSADQMTGVIPITKGGTGANNIHQARLNLKTSCFVIVGNTTNNSETNNGYYQAFSVPTITSSQHTIRLLISPVTSSYTFEEFIVDIKLDTTSSGKNTPIGYINTVKERYDVIDKLYISYDSSATVGDFVFWYKNPSAKSVIRISVLSCTYSNDITRDGLQTIVLNTSGARTSRDTITSSTPNVVSFSEILSTKLATSSMAGYMSSEDKAKLDGIDNVISTETSRLTNLINNAYNNMDPPVIMTDTEPDIDGGSIQPPYIKHSETTMYTITKPNGGSSNINATNTFYEYKLASESNDGLLTRDDYTYLKGLPSELTELENIVTSRTTNLVVGESDTAAADAAVTSNGVYLNLLDNSIIRNSHKITGSNGVTITSDASGNITIKGTTYTTRPNPYALTYQFNGVTQDTYNGSSAKTLNITPDAIGASANTHNHDSTYLKLTGGTISGNLTVTGSTTIGNALAMNDGVHAREVMWLYDDGDTNDYGSELVIDGAGNLFIGSGESPRTLRTALQSGLKPGDVYSKTGNAAYFSSDTNLYLYANLQSDTNRRGIVFDAIGYLRPLVTNTRQLGSSSYYWNKAYITEIYGTLKGNANTATTATKLATTRTISLTGSITGSGAFDGSGDLSIITTTNHTHDYLPLSGGTLTGQLIVRGNAASKPIIVRGIVGSDGNGNVGELYLQHGANFKIYLGNTGAYNISADGGSYSGNSATATTAASANKLTNRRTISLTGAVTGSGTFDGSGDLSITTTTSTVSEDTPGLMPADDKLKLDYTNIAFCTCDTAAATVEKVVNIVGNTKWQLKPGAIIMVYGKNTNSAPASKLNVNGTGAKSIAYYGTVRTDASYSITQNQIMTYVYDGTKYNFLTKSWDHNDANWLRHFGNIKCNSTTPFTKHTVIVGNNGVYTPLKTGNAFDISYQILVTLSATAVNKETTDTYIALYNVQISATQEMTLTAYKPIFIKGKLVGTTFTPISTTPLTQTIPTTDDGYHYILLGNAVTSTLYYLLPVHPIFAFKGGSFGPISSKGITDLSVSGQTVTYTRGDGTTGTITTKDTVTTVTTSGSGNAVTAVTASNGALTVTKGSTFLTAHPTISKSTNTTSTAYPAVGGSFTVIDSVTQDTNGHITKVNTKTVALPSVYATCATARATADKVATLANFTLTIGARVLVKFTDTGTANPTSGTLTLNVNNTGAKQIKYINTGYIATPALTLCSRLSNNYTQCFTYDGTYWIMEAYVNTNDAVTNTLNATTKAYITGTTSATTNTGTQIFDTGVYLETTAGRLRATSFNENGLLLKDKYKTFLRAQVGQNANCTAKPYYKFASTSFSIANEDRSITFKVTTGYGDKTTMVGILTAHVRTNGNKYWDSGELVWEYAASGVDTSKFIYAHNTNSATTIVELWACVDTAYRVYKFNVISECTRVAALNGSTNWQLYNTVTTSTSGNVAAVTSGYTTFTSTLATLKNPISGNATTATSATTASILNTSQPITTSLTTESYIKGNTGTAIINSTATAGYTMLAKMNSTNGCFTTGIYNDKWVLYYTNASTISANTNAYTKALTLLNESGNSYFPGNVSLSSGWLNINPGSSSNFTEGIRIHSATNGWASIMLCGTDNTGDAGTSAKTWSMHAINGNFYLSKNGSNSASVKLSCDTSGVWKVNNNQILDAGNYTSYCVYSADCATASNVLAKVVTNVPNFTLKVGTTIAVNFTDTGTTYPTSGNFTLNVNDTGAKPIAYERNGFKYNMTYWNGNLFRNNIVHFFTYTGIYWLCTDVGFDGYVANTLNNTTKAYLTGTTSTSSNTGSQIFDNGVYITTTAGQMNATSYKVAEKVTMQYNTSEQCLNFVFS